MPFCSFGPAELETGTCLASSAKARRLMGASDPADSGCPVPGDRGDDLAGDGGAADAAGPSNRGWTLVELFDCQSIAQGGWMGPGVALCVVWPGTTGPSMAECGWVTAAVGSQLGSQLGYFSAEAVSPPGWSSNAARAHAVVVSVLTPAEILIAARRRGSTTPPGCRCWHRASRGAVAAMPR